ncbi:hypothetical protein BJV74DRAFT_882473 [Russula compacta]|nr:hypothetical protein BJV74DRAFT_882473 [Russula compacta]
MSSHSHPYNHYDPRWQPGPSLSGPHDATGPHYPPPYPAYPLPSDAALRANPPPPAPDIFPTPANGGYMLPPHAPNALPVADYRERQRVRARITADTWVMGIVIGVMHICAKFTGGTYLVEFESIDGNQGDDATPEVHLIKCHLGVAQLLLPAY